MPLKESIANLCLGDSARMQEWMSDIMSFADCEIELEG